MNKIMNIVDFVRGCEPRDPALDLVTPVVEQIKIHKENNLQSTFLLQYDAMIRDDFKEIFLRERGDNLEVGVWFEIVRPLVEKFGIEWRGREGYDWDWHVNPGFLPAYTQEQRELLIDEVFRLYKEIFGVYPCVAGSWLLDAYSMEYMSKKYDVDAFCICREQYAVDAYTLWGGYYSGGYYPSKKNMICPAQTKQMQINTPVFRMLGIDPIYDNKAERPKAKLGGCYTMEPYWPCGHDEDAMRWYFRTYYENDSLSGSYATTGQENSFGWEGVEQGYRLQVALMKEYEAAGKLKIEKLGKTGADFKKKFDKSPAEALCAFEDWSDNGVQSMWYNCINYRANLHVNEGRLLFRDIQKFDECYEEKYLKNPCTEWKAEYFNLPVVDCKLWSDGDNKAYLCFDKAVDVIVSSKELSEEALEFTVLFADDSVGTVTFSENCITIKDCGDMRWTFGKCDVKRSFSDNKLCFEKDGTTYSVDINASVTVTDGALTIKPQNNKIIISI